MIPPEISDTSKKTTVATQVVTELTSISTVKETINTNEVVVQSDVDTEQRIGCKEGEFLPNSNCNKVSIFYNEDLTNIVLKL